MPDKVFVVGNNLYINRVAYKISNVRFHHHNYLVVVNNLKDINEVEYLINQDVFFNKEDLNLNDDEYIISELLDYEVRDNNNYIGKVTDYDDNSINPLIKVNDKFYIPIKANYIIKVDKINEVIYVKDVEGLIVWK